MRACAWLLIHLHRKATGGHWVSSSTALDLSFQTVSQRTKAHLLGNSGSPANSGICLSLLAQYWVRDVCLLIWLFYESPGDPDEGPHTCTVRTSAPHSPHDSHFDELVLYSPSITASKTWLMSDYFSFFFAFISSCSDQNPSVLHPEQRSCCNYLTCEPFCSKRSFSDDVWTAWVFGKLKAHPQQHTSSTKPHLLIFPKATETKYSKVWVDGGPFSFKAPQYSEEPQKPCPHSSLK